MRTHRSWELLNMGFLKSLILQNTSSFSRQYCFWKKLQKKKVGLVFIQGKTKSTLS